MREQHQHETLTDHVLRSSARDFSLALALWQRSSASHLLGSQ